MWYNKLQNTLVQCTAVRCSVVKDIPEQFSVMQDTAVKFIVVQYTAVQFNVETTL